MKSLECMPIAYSCVPWDIKKLRMKATWIHENHFLIRQEEQHTGEHTCQTSAAKVPKFNVSLFTKRYLVAVL